MNAPTRFPNINAPTDFYMVSAFAETTREWEPMHSEFLDREEAVQIYSDYSDTFARWYIVHVILGEPSRDITDEIAREAASGDDCHSYAAQHTEARLSGHFSQA